MNNQPEQAQKQEPVAWKDAMKVAFWRMYEHGKNDNPVSAQCEVQALGMLCNGEFDDITAWHPSQWKLPPQRQPLTDEEIGDIWNCYCDEMGYASINDAYDIARAIENKLNEKSK